jgi:hypothetical protein
MAIEQELNEDVTGERPVTIAVRLRPSDWALVRAEGRRRCLSGSAVLREILAVWRDRYGAR